MPDQPEDQLAWGFLHTFQHANRDVEERGDQIEDSRDNQTQKPKRKQDNPYQRIQDQRHNGERPAGDQQKKEEDELDHGSFYSYLGDTWGCLAKFRFCRADWLGLALSLRRGRDGADRTFGSGGLVRG